MSTCDEREEVEDLDEKIGKARELHEKEEEETLFLRKKCEEAEVRVAKLREELKKRQRHREGHMKRIIVPTVADILRRAVYEKEAGIAGSVECICGNGNEPEHIRTQKDKFVELGFGEEEVYAFADCVSFDFLHLLIDMQHNEVKLTLSISGLVS